MNDLDECVRRLLDSVQAMEACSCCQNTQHAVHRAGLCRHCYEIKLEISKCKRHQNDHPAYFLKIAEKMGELAQLEGQSFGKVPSEATALDVEHVMSELSKRVLKKDLFRGYATLLGHSFSPEQRRYLLYLLRRILREDSRRTRRRRASFNLQAQ